MTDELRPALPGEKMGRYCLLALGILELVLMVCETMWGGVAFYLVETLALVPGLIFLGWVWSKPGKKPLLLLGLGMVLWMTVTQVTHLLRGEPQGNVGAAYSIYLLAFPFAALVSQEDRKWGLKTMTALYVAASLTICLFALLLMGDILPGFLAGRIDWDGDRLMAGWHPNITACILMMGIGFTMGFSFLAKNPWGRGGLWAAVALQFSIMSLTNCRTSLLMTCGMIAAVVFFWMYRPKWQRVILALVAAAVLFVGLFALSGYLYEANGNRLRMEYLAQQMEPAEPEAPAQTLPESTNPPAPGPEETQPTTQPTVNVEDVKLPTDSGQGSLWNDLKSLNGRTRIWSAALRGMKYQPELLLRGTEYVSFTIRSGDPGGLMVEHAHNSWVQILIRHGIPALLLALVFTALAVWSALAVLFRGKTPMYQKCLSLLTLCLLVAGFLEPFLFGADAMFHFVNTAFFLCTGYLVQWRKEG